MKQRSKKSSEESNPDKNTGSKVNNKAKLPVKLVAKRPTKVVLLFFVLAFYGAWGVYHYQFDNLPGPLSLEHVGKRGFSEHESFKHVKALTDLGPHTVGSEALDSALEYVYEASQAIKKGAFWEVDVEVDLFHANSGANQMKGGLFNGKTLVYSDLTHIVLRISPKYGSEGKEKAILVSSHIDTVFSTEGAGDCSSCVAVMLELARGVSQWAHGFKNSIIFLFNTGEEEGLNGAHSFITQHPWSDTIQVAIDLEAMGIGGKSGIFQAGPHPWAMEIYGAVAKHPSGQIVAQDLFNSGAIKSATDFQVYKEVAGLSGLDFAYADHTAVYHTKNDKLSLLRPGSLQHLGDNMLAFLLQAGASADLPKANEEAPGGTSEHDPATYFDILGMYMIVYRQNFATILYNSIIAQTLLILALSLFMGGFPAIISLLLSFASVLLMWMFSISFASSIACILPFISSNPVPYVAHPWLVIGLFGGPGLIGAFIGQHVGFVLLEMWCENVLGKRGNVGPGDIDVLAKLEAERWVFKGGLVQWLVLLIIGNYFRVGSVYLAVFWLVSPAFAYGLLEATLSPARLPKPLKSITLLLGLSLPFTLTSGMAIRLASTIIGSSVRFERSPGTMPEWLSNLIVAIYVAAVICLTMVYLLSYIHISGAKVPIIGVSCILLVLSLGLVYTGMVPPFTEDTSRAVNVVHVIDATENQEPVANILLFSSTPGDLLKEVKHIDEDFYCGKNKSLDFVTFTMKYGCWMNKGAENGWSRSNIPVLSIGSDVKNDERVTQVLINTKESIRWVLGINFEAIEDFTLRDDIEELISSGEKSSVDGWHTIQFSGGRKSSTKFILTLFWAKNYTFKGDNKKKEQPLLKLRTDLPLVTPPVENVLEKLPPWCSLFGKSTSPHTLSFLNTLPINL